MTSVTKELSFKFYLIIINLKVNLNSYMWLAATTLNRSLGVTGQQVYGTNIKPEHLSFFLFFPLYIHTARILVGQRFTRSFCLTPPQESASSLVNIGKKKDLKIYRSTIFAKWRIDLCIHST